MTWPGRQRPRLSHHGRHDSTPNQAFGLHTTSSYLHKAWSWTGLGWNHDTGKGFWPQKRSITASNSECQGLLLSTIGNQLNWGVGGSIGLVWCNCRCSEASAVFTGFVQRVRGGLAGRTAARRGRIQVNTTSDAFDLFFYHLSLSLVTLYLPLSTLCSHSEWFPFNNSEYNIYFEIII